LQIRKEIITQTLNQGRGTGGNQKKGEKKEGGGGGVEEQRTKKIEIHRELKSTSNSEIGLGSQSF